MATPWEICPTCASVVANIHVHNVWHAVVLPEQIAAIDTSTPNDALEG